MNFIQAIRYLYQNKTSDEELLDPFLLYCKMSDLCGASYEDKRKVSLFYQINKRINMVDAILKNDKTIHSKHTQVADLLSEKSYQRLLDSVKSVLLLDYKPQEKLAKQPQKKMAVAVAVVKKAEQSEQSETRTPLVSNYAPNQNQQNQNQPNQNQPKNNTDLIIGASVFGGIVLVIALLITFACIFGWGWTFWQWFIGIVGAIVLVFILWLTAIFICDVLVTEGFIVGTVLLGICIVLNFIFVLIFKSNYKIIFGCYSVFEILFGIMLCFYTFSENQEEWGIGQIVESVLALVLFVLAIIFI